MQNQAARTALGDFGFAGKLPTDNLEKIVFPLQNMAVGLVHDGSGERLAVNAQFGLVPHWVKDDKGGPRYGRYCYNARSETVFEKPSFRQAILQRRAVLPVSSFYEFPDKEEPLQHRFRIHQQDDEPFWLAGLWEYHRDYELTSFSILTTGPMKLLADFHSRSPLVLDDHQIDGWLDPGMKKPDAIAGFFKVHDSNVFQLEKQAWSKKAPQTPSEK